MQRAGTSRVKRVLYSDAMWYMAIINWMWKQSCKFNLVYTRRRKANWIGHILHKNCLLKHVIKGKIEGRIEVTGRRGRRRMQLLDNFKEKRRYFKLKEEALDRTLRRTRVGRSYGPVVKQDYRINE